MPVEERLLSSNLLRAFRSHCLLGSGDFQSHSERKLRTGFVDFVTDADYVKDAESQAIVGDWLSLSTQSGRDINCHRRYVRMRSRTTSRSSAIRYRVKACPRPRSGDGFRAPVRGRVFTGMTAKCPHNLAKSSRDHAVAARK